LNSVARRQGQVNWHGDAEPVESHRKTPIHVKRRHERLIAEGLQAEQAIETHLALRDKIWRDVTRQAEQEVLVLVERAGAESLVRTGSIRAQGVHLILQRIPTVKLSLGAHVVVDARHSLILVLWCASAYVLRRGEGHPL